MYSLQAVLALAASEKLTANPILPGQKGEISLRHRDGFAFVCYYFVVFCRTAWWVEVWGGGGGLGCTGSRQMQRVRISGDLLLLFPDPGTAHRACPHWRHSDLWPSDLRSKIRTLACEELGSLTFGSHRSS